MMARRLTLVFIILTLASGVLAGTPLHAPDDGMMECCKRAKSNEQSQAAEAARLCCSVNCSSSTPTSSGVSFNPAPANFTITKSISEQIAVLLAKGKTAPIVRLAYSQLVLPPRFQPKYIQHQAFLI
jgi:hypothetical protein